MLPGWQEKTIENRKEKSRRYISLPYGRRKNRGAPEVFHLQKLVHVQHQTIDKPERLEFPVLWVFRLVCMSVCTLCVCFYLCLFRWRAKH